MEKERLNLYARRHSSASTEQMCQVAHKLQDANFHYREEINRAEMSIKSITNHDHVKIVNSGNGAILAVMSTLNGPILIPDQGGWTGFRQIAEFLNINVQEIKTRQGIINPYSLLDILKKNKIEALFLTSLAGYMAEQPLEELYAICQEEGVLLVEDASGAVGDDQGKLACAKHAHVIIGSTGSPKIVNVGNGGFISTNYSKIFRTAATLLKTLKPSPLTCAGIVSEIKNAPHIFSKTVHYCDILKENLEIAIYPQKRGVSVGLPVKNPEVMGARIKEQINVVGTNLISICPRYDRIMEPAICLELKNIALECLDQENMNRLIEIVNNALEQI